MNSVDYKISEYVEKYIQHERVLGIRIPEGEPYSRSLIVPRLSVIYYEKDKQKLCISKPNHSSLVEFLSWGFKLILFIIQTIFVFPVSIYTIYTLLADFIKLGRLKSEYEKDLNYSLIKSASKHFRIHRNPQKKQRKIKKILYFTVDKFTSREELGSILFIYELIKYNKVNNIGIVIASTIEINQLNLQNLVFEDNEIDNQFVYHFNRKILNYIRNEHYIEAAGCIRAFLLENGINNISEFEFVMQCLAFCYQNLSVNDFIEQFSGTTLSVSEDIGNGKEHHFIKDANADLGFLEFCYRYLLQFYRARMGISDDNYNADFKSVVTRIKSILELRKDYMSAAKLGAKFLNSEESADLFIISFVHMEFVENKVSDECLNYLRAYASHNIERASIFCLLYDGDDICLNADAIEAMVERIAMFEDIDPLVKLVFYYYLSNLMYLYNIEPSIFMTEYSRTLDEVHDYDALKCLFSAQFLLFYTTVENIEIRSRFVKRVSILLEYVLRSKELLTGKKIYIKICRSLNGIRGDRFNVNLSDMLLVKDVVKNFDIEKIFYDINLGAMYVYRSNTREKDYKTALEIYHNIDKKLMKILPQRIQLSYYNNLCVIEYLNNPSKRTAYQKYLQTDKYLSEVTANYTILEEIRHLYVNRIIFALISGVSDKIIRGLIQKTEELAADDNYFLFYLQQCKNLYFTFMGQDCLAEPTEVSVFFINKKSFFEEKLAIMSKLAARGSVTLRELNKSLENGLSNYKDDYNYFKRADLFSLDERWYE